MRTFLIPILFATTLNIEHPKAINL
jgi:hypothetical protein